MSLSFHLQYIECDSVCSGGSVCCTVTSSPGVPENILLALSSIYSFRVSLNFLFYRHWLSISEYEHVLALPLYITCSVSVSAYLGIAYEYAVEMTYPLPKPVSASLVNVVSQVSAYVCVCCTIGELSHFCIVFAFNSYRQIFKLFLVFFIGKYYLRIGMWTTVAFTGCAAFLAGWLKKTCMRCTHSNV